MVYWNVACDSFTAISAFAGLYYQKKSRRQVCGS